MNIIKETFQDWLETIANHNEQRQLMAKAIARTKAVYPEIDDSLWNQQFKDHPEVLAAFNGPKPKKCPNIVDGNCSLHNLHCQWPDCQK